MSLVVVSAGLAAVTTNAAAEGRTRVVAQVCVYINCTNIDKLTPAVTAMS